MLLCVAALAGCAETSRLPEGADVGADPALPEPTRTLIPTVKIAPAKGWPQGATPKAAPGMRVRAFATGLQHPRWLYVLPNGDVLTIGGEAPDPFFVKRVLTPFQRVAA